ncbi:Increased DNA methylation 2 [Capsicum chinense]|nr:Increased DNA methylation 2 [Capsicum chinense]
MTTECLIRVLLAEDESVSSNFLLHLFKIGLIMNINGKPKNHLKTRIALMLEKFSAQDLLVRNSATVFDVDIVVQVVEGYVSLASNNPKSRMFVVGRLVDEYLALIARDENLVSRSSDSLVNALPKEARFCDDNLYRYIDMYLKEHPDITEEERRSICRKIKYHNLSQEARSHALKKIGFQITSGHYLFFLNRQYKSGAASPTTRSVYFMATKFRLVSTVAKGPGPRVRSRLGSRLGARSSRVKWDKGASRLRIGSWNTGALQGKFIELVKILRKWRISTACVQEIKWVGSMARDVDRESQSSVSNSGEANSSIPLHPQLLNVAPISLYPCTGPPLPYSYHASSSSDINAGSISVEATREEWDNLINHANGGVALTGSVLLGKVGPVIGAVDIAESEDAYVFRVSLPGVARDEKVFRCDVGPNGRILIKGVSVTGERKVRRKNMVFKMQTQNLCPPGEFTASFQLRGPIDHLNLSCNFGPDGIFEGVAKKKQQGHPTERLDHSRGLYPWHGIDTLPIRAKIGPHQYSIRACRLGYYLSQSQLQLQFQYQSLE